jgi:hypothetical protein
MAKSVSVRLLYDDLGQVADGELTDLYVPAKSTVAVIVPAKLNNEQGQFFQFGARIAVDCAKSWSTVSFAAHVTVNVGWWIPDIHFTSDVPVSCKNTKFGP